MAKVFEQLWLVLWTVARAPASAIGAAAVSLIVATTTSLPTWEIVTHALPILFITMSGFTINDIIDRDKDRLAVDFKPIARHLVPISLARFTAVILAASALFIAWIVRRNSSFEVAVITFGGVLGYSYFARFMPLIKGALTGALSCTPMIYAATISDGLIDWWILFLLMTFILGRELLFDLLDLKADLSIGMRTLPALLNARTCRLIGWVLMLGSVSALAVASHGLPRLLTGMACVSLLFCGAICISNEVKGLRWTRITLVLGMAGVAASM